MTVYVDDALIAATVGPITSRWSHLMSDLAGEPGTAELVDFAALLDMRHTWIQCAGTAREHFDLTEEKREWALRLGAVPLRYGRECVALIRTRRLGLAFDLAAVRAAQVAAQVTAQARPQSPASS